MARTPPSSPDPRPAGERNVNRRRFLDWLLGTTLGGFMVSVAYPVARFLTPPPVREASTSSVVLPFPPGEMSANSGRIFRFGTRPGIVIRTPSGELRAFSARCTHLDCTVQFRDDLGHIWCACHNGHFDLNGRNIAGPPPEPLQAFDVNVRGDQIVVSLRS